MVVPKTYAELVIVVDVLQHPFEQAAESRWVDEGRVEVVFT